MAPVIGVWGKPTATIDWCEENYNVTPYIAEFWNTISNLVFIIPSVVMFIVSNIENHEDRYKWCHIAVFVVGFGSWCFHMTLLYSMQLLDELPMIYGSCFLLYSHVEVLSPENKSNRPLQILLILWSIGVTVIYVATKHVLFFQVCYAFMVALMVLSSIKILRYYKHSTRLFVASFVTYTSGFGLWLIDQHLCGTLQCGVNYNKLWYNTTLIVMLAAGACWVFDQLKCGDLKFLRFQILPKFLSPFTELHAWWHILAGLGTYLSVFFSAHTRYLHLNKNPQIRFCMGCWPYLTIPQKTETDAKQY